MSRQTLISTLVATAALVLLWPNDDARAGRSDPPAPGIDPTLVRVHHRYRGHYGPHSFLHQSHYLHQYNYYGSPYAYGYDPHPRAQSYTQYGDVKIKVKPDHAQVYVDGAHAGNVDDFNGFLQSLSLESGPYEIEIRLDGYDTHRSHIYVTASKTYTIRHVMQRVADGV